MADVNKSIPSFIYCITNTVNGKRYVGKTNRPSNRWSEHKSDARKGWKDPIYRAMRKYGIGNFIFILIAEYESEEIAYSHENGWIDKLQSRSHQWGYNCRDGGKGGTIRSEESRKRMSEARKGIPCSEETKTKLSKVLAGRKQPLDQMEASVNGLREYLAPRKEELRQKVKELHKQGLTATAIGDKLGFTKTHICNILKELNLRPNGKQGNGNTGKPNKGGRVSAPERIGSQVVELRNRGYSWLKIAKELGCGRTTAKTCYKQMMLKINEKD